MYPELFSIGPFTLHSFGLMMGLGFTAAAIVAYFGFKQKGVNPDYVYWLTIAAVAGGLLGSKINYLLLHLDDLRNEPLSMAFSGAGLVWYGGLAGGLLAAVIVMYLFRIPRAKVLDASAPAIAIGLAFGRIGCFLNGCDYGMPSTLPWAMEFPKGAPPTPEGITVQPSQLYEVLASLLIFGILIYLMPRLKRDWCLFSAYLVMAGITRFLIEFTRYERGGQEQQVAIALIIVFIGAALFMWAQRRPQPR